MIFGILGLVGGIIFALMALIGLLLQNGKAKRNFVFSISFFILFFAAVFSFGVPDNDEKEAEDVATDSATEEDKETDETEDTLPVDKSDESFPDTTSNASEAPDESSNDDKEDTIHEEDEDPHDGIVYEVGEDIDPGKYIVVTTDPDIAYMENSKDSSGEVESILFNNNFFEMDANAYVTLNEGEFFRLKGMDIHPADDYELEPKDGTFGDGMYKAGKDIEPGEYELFLDKDTGYAKVAMDSSHDIDSVIDSKFLEGEDDSISVSEGEYLILKGIHIEVD